MHHYRNESSKDKCVGHLAIAFDAVLNHERLSIHVRAHLMEALANVQSSVKRWKAGSGEVRRELARLRQFARGYLPATASTVREHIESVADVCESFLDDSEAQPEAEQPDLPSSGLASVQRMSGRRSVRATVLA